MKKLDKKIFLKSQLLTKLGVEHGFFTRNGGISSDEYKSLNCKFNCSDKNENVENEERENCSLNISIYCSLANTNW